MAEFKVTSGEGREVRLGINVDLRINVIHKTFVCILQYIKSDSTKRICTYTLNQNVDMNNI